MLSCILHTPFSLLYSTLKPFWATCFKLRWDLTLKLHTTLLIIISMLGSSRGVTSSCSSLCTLWTEWAPLLASFTRRASLFVVEFLLSSVAAAFAARGTRLLMEELPLGKTEPCWRVIAIPLPSSNWQPHFTVNKGKENQISTLNHYWCKILLSSVEYARIY